MALPVFDKYQVSKKIGSNLCYTLWEARDTASGDRVYIRLLKPEFAQNSEIVSAFFERARDLKLLNHKGIYRVFRYGSVGSNHFVVTEPAGQYEPLEVLILEETPVRLDEIHTLLRSIYETIQFAHLKGVVHGLLNPRTIHMKADGSVKLDAFDLAWYIPYILQSTSKEAVYFTRYIAPECNQIALPDGRSDLYSIGATLYHLLTKYPPFAGETVDEVRKAQRKMPELNLRAQGFPSTLEVLIRKSIAPDIRERAQNIGQIVHLLGQFQKSIGISIGQDDSPPAEETSRPQTDLEFIASSAKHRSGSVVARIALGILLIAVFVVFYLGYEYFGTSEEPSDAVARDVEQDTFMPTDSGSPMAEPPAVDGALEDSVQAGNNIHQSSDPTENASRKETAGLPKTDAGRNDNNPGAGKKAVSVTQAPRTTANLLVKAEGKPTQANVFEGEKFIGRSDKDGRFEATDLVIDKLYEIKVTKEGYQSRTRSLLVDASMNLLIFDLKPDNEQIGTLIVHAEPDADSVIVDGELRARGTPLELKLRWGTHTVRLVNSRLGESHEEKVDLKVGQILRIRHDFAIAATGKVAISLKNAAEYGYAYVYVDDELWSGGSNTTPLEIELPVGKHKISVQREGFTSLPPEVFVNVQAGETLHTGFRLTE